MYAGFWKRLFASILDYFIIYVLAFMLAFLELMFDMLVGIGKGLILLDNRVFEIVYSTIRVAAAFSVPWLYYAILESSKLQGTIGKKALGIIVVDQNYERVTFLRASGRFWSRIISMLTIYVGYIMAAFTQRKQALHDIIAKTYVVDKKVLELSKGNPELYLNGVHMEGQQA